MEIYQKNHLISNLISKLLVLKTTVDIPIIISYIISYIIEHNRTSMFQIWIVSSCVLPANFYLVGFVKKNFRCSVTAVEIEVTFFWADLMEFGRGKLGVN